jgi:uncharacterized protein YkwD
MTPTARYALAVVASLLTTTAPSARGDDSLPPPADRNGLEWLEVLNDARFDDCGRAPELAPLQEDSALARVVQRYADGGSLQQALEAARYPAEQAAALRIDAVRLDPRAVRQRLRERFCTRLGDPAMQVAAAVQRGNSLWFVIATAADGAAEDVMEDKREKIPASEPDAIPEVDATASSRDGIEYEIIAQVNEARATPRRCGTRQFAAAPPLRYSPQLADASQAHATDMARRGYFDHDTPDGVQPTERLAKTGYRWKLTGENIAQGDMNADEAMAGWLRSPGHCANIMEPRFSEMGFGIAADGDRKGSLYWVQTFAAPRDDDSSR